MRKTTEQNRGGRRVFAIWIPSENLSYRELLVLGVGIVLSWIAAFQIAMIPVLLRYAGKPDPPSSAYTIPIFIGFAGVAVWCVWISRRIPARLKKQRRRRTARLKRALQADAAIERLPHRFVEYELLSRNRRKRALAKALERLPPGTFILVNGPPRSSPSFPIAINISFEPIDIARDAKELYEIARLTLIAKVGEAEFDRQTVEDESEGGSVGGFASGLLRFLGILWVPYFGYNTVMGSSESAWIFGFGLILMILGWLIFGVGLDERWWVVPGGFIRRRTSLWTRRTEGTLVTAEQSPVYLDATADLGWVVIDGKATRFQYAHEYAWPIAAAWLSEGRTPSLDEVHAFLGPDVRMKTW